MNREQRTTNNGQRATSRTSLLRSYLFAPGNSEKLLVKVFDAGADAIVLDLEDAVPREQKAHARTLVAETLHRVYKAVLTNHELHCPAVYVRINAVSSGLWREDIAAIASPLLRGIRLAKAESAAEIHAVAEALADAEEKAELHIGSLTIVPTIENAVGIMASAEMAKMPRVEAFSFGNADFVKDIGAEPDEFETQTLYARSHLVLVSRAAGIRPPIASVHTLLKDVDGLRATTEAARRLGFFGRSCIHPSQVPVINEIFTPQPEQIAEARSIIEAFEKATATGAGVAQLDNGQFIDAPIVERARSIVKLADNL